MQHTLSRRTNLFLSTTLILSVKLSYYHPESRDHEQQLISTFPKNQVQESVPTILHFGSQETNLHHDQVAAFAASADSPGWFEEEARNVSRAISHISPEHQTTVEPPTMSTSRSRAQDSITSSVVTSPVSVSNFIRRGSAPEDATSSPTDIWYNCASEFHADGILCEGYADSTLLLYEPLDQISLLLHHYFSLVCPISSSFDSGQSPFRSNVLGMMVGSRLLFLCVMNMSASHFHRDDYTSTTPLSFQTEAISEISTELCKINNSAMVNSGETTIDQTLSLLSLPYPVKDEVLLGIILLGMTSVSPMPISR
ncbi:uncharacterized protein CLUP02_16906 [Colletotrichum lupini]|uniref:Uncharacterized protein n=1 Tax=Colletotrichum lupini TaxID=145971 RepID=A0A9Q8WQF7_9PEZI|nr:uncharacterized protein CLUP02_16906 [Colletotrichum lupini]UQC91372.1 hypothetical protein CLUP02_16906 [Colletotrichum lupini]